MADRPGGRVLLITGASSGIGADAAATLAARGWRVFGTVRRAADRPALEAAGVTPVHMEMTQPETIAAGLREILDATGGRLDALFSNAAHATPGLVEDLPPDALRAIFEANLFGLHDLTRRAIPVMRAQGAGRIVQCGSVLGRVAAPYRGAYVATKFALTGLTDALRLELHGTGLHVCLIEPGPITSRIRHNAARHFERWVAPQAQARGADYARLRARLYASDGPPDRFELPASAVTRRLIHALEAPRPRARYRVTVPSHAAEALRRALPTRALDAVLRR
ncbi:MAG: SDR family NAD(P)-dependent oxidoreductase [Paracoccaceae bacterium]